MRRDVEDLQTHIDQVMMHLDGAISEYVEREERRNRLEFGSPS